MRLLVHRHRMLTAPGADGDGRYFPGVKTLINSTLCPRKTLDGKGIHALARQTMSISRFLRKGAHGGPGVSVFEAIDKHVIKQFGMPKPLTLAPAHQNLRRVRHTLKPAADHELVGAGSDAVDAKNGGLHAAAAGLINCDRASGAWNAGCEHGLPRWALLQPRR